MKTEIATQLESLRMEFRTFFDEHASPEYVDRCDNEGTFPHELFGAAASAGIFKYSIPEEYGGHGIDFWALTILLQEAGRCFPDFANTLVRSQTLCATLVREFGSERQRSELLPRFADGSMHMAFAITEPQAGSDALALSTVAQRDGDEWVVTGNKIYATGADVADTILCIARLEGTVRRDGIVAVLIDPASPGLTIERLETLGVRATGSAALTFESVRAPDSAILGEAGSGLAVLVGGLDMERLATAAIATGASRGLISHVVAFLKERMQFGSPLSELQIIRHRLADLATRVDAAELATFRVAHLLAEGRPAHLEASIAKLSATETYMAVAHSAVQLEGGWGYTFDRTVQRHFRDAKMYEIGGGASDVQRDIIARRIGL